MKPQLIKGLKAFLFLSVSILFFNASYAQNSNRIEWSKDTLSRDDVKGANDTYKNTIRGSGQNPTQQINLPVDKLKEILDACYSSGVSNVAVLFITLRQKDVARYKRNNPGTTAPDNEIKGSQMFVIKVPRNAFAGKAGAKINVSGNNSLPLSLLSSGLVQLKESYKELPFAAGSLYFSFGTLCPPPSSCDPID